jgi:hypothetical protein
MAMWTRSNSSFAGDVQIGLKLAEVSSNDPALAGGSSIIARRPDWTMTTLRLELDGSAGFAQPSIDLPGAGCIDFYDVHLVRGP